MSINKYKFITLNSLSQLTLFNCYELSVSRIFSGIAKGISILFLPILFFSTKCGIRTLFAGLIVFLLLLVSMDVRGSHAAPAPKPGECLTTTEDARECLSKLGVKVYIPSSVYKNGLYLLDRFLTRPKAINSTILYWVDARVREWIKSHPNKNSNDLLKVAKRYKFVIHDHWGFKCSASPTGLCNGLHQGSKRRIDACIYFKIETTKVPDRDYIPPHTVMTSKEVAEWAKNKYWNKGSKAGKYYWGTIAIHNMGLYVIPHELDHAIGIDNH